MGRFLPRPAPLQGPASPHSAPAAPDTHAHTQTTPHQTRARLCACRGAPSRGAQGSPRARTTDPPARPQPPRPTLPPAFPPCVSLYPSSQGARRRAPNPNPTPLAHSESPRARKREPPLARRAPLLLARGCCVRCAAAVNPGHRTLALDVGAWGLLRVQEATRRGPVLREQPLGGFDSARARVRGRGSAYVTGCGSSAPAPLFPPAPRRLPPFLLPPPPRPQRRCAALSGLPPAPLREPRSDRCPRRTRTRARAPSLHGRRPAARIPRPVQAHR
jgi:hypothetical protein